MNWFLWYHGISCHIIISYHSIFQYFKSVCLSSFLLSTLTVFLFDTCLYLILLFVSHVLSLLFLLYLFRCFFTLSLPFFLCTIFFNSFYLKFHLQFFLILRHIFFHLVMVARLILREEDIQIQAYQIWQKWK